MTSQKKATANRRNAKKSTGPKTERGKAHARKNAVTHGFYATLQPVGDEDDNEYRALEQRLIRELKPQSAIENMLVDQILGDMWRLRRIALAEEAHFERLGAGAILPPSLRSNIGVAVKNNPTAPNESSAAAVPRSSAECARQSDTISADLTTSVEAKSAAAAVTQKPIPHLRVRAVLLQGMAGDPEFAYSTLEQMRRSLVRDIMKQYESLREIQGESLTMAPLEDAAPTPAPEERLSMAAAENDPTMAQSKAEGPANTAPDADQSSTPPSKPRRPTSRRVGNL